MAKLSAARRTNAEEMTSDVAASHVTCFTCRDGSRFNPLNTAWSLLHVQQFKREHRGHFNNRIVFKGHFIS